MPDPTPTTTTTAPGVQTSEFWLALIAPAATKFAGDILGSKDPTERIVTLCVVGLCATAYIITRAWLKARVVTATAQLQAATTPKADAGPTLFDTAKASTPAIVALVLSTLAMLGLGGCATPAQAQPYAQSNAAVVQQLSTMVAQQQAATGALLATVATQRATLVQAEALRQPVANDWVTVGDWATHPDKFSASVANAQTSPTRAYLVGEVREGRMTQEQALQWLADYAVAQKLSKDTGGPLLATLAGRLQPVAQARELVTTLVEANNARSATLAAGFGQLDANAQAFIQWSTATPTVASLTGPDAMAVWDQLLAGYIKDPARRAAALQALGTLAGSGK